MPFFHAILCTGSRSFHNFVAHCHRADTLAGAIAAAEPYIRHFRAEQPCTGYFLRTFKVYPATAHGPAVGVEVDPDTGKVLHD